MDPKEFISSGIIESYLLGSASEADAVQVKQMSEMYPEVRKEIERVEEGLFEFASLHKIDPPAELKNKILNQIKDGKSSNGIYKSIAADAPANLRSRERVLTYLMAACIILLLVSIYINLMFFRKVSFLQQQVENYNSEKEVLVLQVNNQQKMIDNTQQQMNVVLDPRFTKVSLKGVEHSPTSFGAIFWNSQTQQVYMHVYSLPKPSPEKQYQLWAIVDGKPVDAGILDQNISEELFGMKSISNAQAFAVTLENKGGSAVPTLTEMYMMGSVSL